MTTRRPLISALTLTLATGFATPSAAQPEPSRDEAPPARPRKPAAADDVGMTEDEFFGDDTDDAEAGEAPVVDTEAPPPAGRGAVVGKLTSGDGLPVIDAQVTVQGTSIRTLTDLEGRFRLDLPPGTYDIRFFSPGYDAVQLQGVVVERDASVEVAPAFADGKPNLVETVEIEVEADTSSVEGQLLTRKRSAVVGDGIARGDIARTPDRDAAAAVRRVVGVLIVNGKYVYVRGIGERYTNALLDGSPLPSPEPEQQTVPLDLFPTNVLDSLTVVKTYTPDMMGNFAGGSVRIGTRRLPDRFTFSVSGSVGFNSQSTFREYLQYPGGDLDWLGVDDGSRALPSEVPGYQVKLGNRRPDGSFIDQGEADRVGQAINSPMSTRRTMAPVDHRFSLTAGNTFDFGDDQKLGVQLAASYGRSFERRPNERLRTFFADPNGDLLLRNDLTLERGIDEVRWSVLGGLTYQPAKDHRIHLTGLYSISSDNEAFEVEGQHAERIAPVHETRLAFRSRNLVFGQLRGEHDFPALHGARLDYNASVSRAYRDQPDTRATVFQFGEAFGYGFEDDSQSGWHFFSELEEMVYGAGLDWTQPIVPGDEGQKVKIGARYDTRSRDFYARRFRFRPNFGVPAPVCEASSWDPTCPDRIFDDANIGPVFTIEENTLETDAYDASVDVWAVYAMADLHLAKNLRLVAGPRLEMAVQRIHVFNQFAPDDPDFFKDARVTGQDILPGASLIWEVVDNMNLRLAASRTVARPQLREIAPFAYTDYFGGFQEQGNPELIFTHIWNGDLRWEWFPTLREVLAASVFVKRFENPIEQIIVASGSQGIITYQNTPGANLIGGEVEARKQLGFIAEDLEDLALIANVTFAFSRADLGDVDFLTSKERPLVNQAPWIVNASVDYDNDDIGFQARLLYNIIGPRIIQVGARNLPDVYEQPRHQLDLTLAQRVAEGLRITASGKNLVNDDLRATYGEEDLEENLHRQYRTGIEASIGASYTY